jgi:hypothetical protein
MAIEVAVFVGMASAKAASIPVIAANATGCVSSALFVSSDTDVAVAVVHSAQERQYIYPSDAYDTTFCNGLCDV